VYLHNLQQRPLVPGEREQSVEILFTPSTGENLFVACLWAYVEPAGDDPGFYTFAVITDDPPLEVIEAGHDRCPVPIHEDDIDAWLDPKPRQPGTGAIAPPTRGHTGSLRIAITVLAQRSAVVRHASLPLGQLHWPKRSCVR
jgi:putative SOS response-associated peptidase YedK